MPKLPTKLMSRTIADIEYGEWGYTVPWAMYIGPSNEMYLNGSYTLHDDSLGTVTMLVAKTEDGITVDIKSCDFTWNENAHYVGEFSSIKVDVLHCP